jgi:hypothetical protein
LDRLVVDDVARRKDARAVRATNNAGVSTCLVGMVADRSDRRMIVLYLVVVVVVRSRAHDIKQNSSQTS